MSLDFDMDEVKKELEELSAPETDRFRLEAGKTTFVILPWKGKKFFEKTKMHFNVNGVSFECSSECFLCQRMHQLPLKTARRIQARVVYLVRVFNLGTKSVQIGFLPKSVARSILEMVTTEFSDIFSTERPRPVTVIKSGTGLETKYTVLPGKDTIDYPVGKLEPARKPVGPPSEEQLKQVEQLFSEPGNPEAELESFFQ